MLKNVQINRDNEFMQEAINQAIAGNTGFGCLIAENDAVVVKAFNTVKTDLDPTAHAEINAIRKLAKIPDYRNKKFTIYTSGEPCPMCMAAIMYAGISRVVFGLSIPEISNFIKQISISSTEIVEKGFREIEIAGGILHEDCLNLFQTIYHDKR
ncbi:MAG: nucleoside deaminase [Bacteroidales bacterium]|nr:nucleoside deaminase [Bacteroidales bacterium]